MSQTQKKLKLKKRTRVLDVSIVRIFVLVSNVYVHETKFVMHDVKIVSNVYAHETKFVMHDMNNFS